MYIVCDLRHKWLYGAVLLQRQWPARCFLHPDLPKRHRPDQRAHSAERTALQSARQPEKIHFTLCSAHLLHELVLQADGAASQAASRAAKADVQEGSGSHAWNGNYKHVTETQQSN